ncbi:MAG: D-glutamate cyclase family protein, partial [Planctomycetota bacterium]
MDNLTEKQAGQLTPTEMRDIIRRGNWTGPAEMACIGYWKANLVVLPQDWAFEFMLFAQRNPQPCWIAAPTDPGDPCPRQLAQDADLRTDLPRYRVFKNGQLIDEPTDIVKYWRDDLVAFLIGVFPNIALSLQNANVRYRHVGSYTSNIPCEPAGRLHGNMAVTCTIFKTSHDAVKAIQVSSRYPDAHGAPVHIGDGAS